MVMTTDKGFTLLEILVAISIASLLLLAIYGVFGSLSQARDQVESRGAVYHQARVLYDRLGKELHSLAPAYSTGVQQLLSLSGGKDDRGQTYLELDSLAATPMSGAAGIAATVRYLWAEDTTPGSTEKALYRSERMRWATGDDQPGPRLLAAVADFDVSFFDGTQWQQDWPQNATKLPDAVRIGLTLVDGNERVPFRTVFDLP
jgi:general secretion pathway protein J